MPYPCEQEQSIKHITSTLDRLERGFEKLVELLQINAQRETEVLYLKEEAAKAYKSIDELYERMRKVEVAIAEAEPTTRLEILHSVNELNSRFDNLDKQLNMFNTIFTITTHKSALVIYGVLVLMILVGFYNDMYYHGSSMLLVWHWLKGG